MTFGRFRPVAIRKTTIPKGTRLLPVSARKTSLLDRVRAGGKARKTLTEEGLEALATIKESDRNGEKRLP